MSRSLLAIGICFILSFSFGQNAERNPVERHTYVKLFTYGPSYTWIGKRAKAKGSVYLYENWNTRAVIETKSGKTAMIKNVNFNVDSQVFEALFGKDSTYLFDFNELNSITLNNKKYSKFEHKGKQDVFELIYESDGLSLLKTYKLNVFTASTNPMVNRTTDMYTKRNAYFVRQGKTIKEIALNRKNIIRIFEKNNVNRETLELFVTDRNLSYKNEFDVQMMFKHFMET